MCIIKSKEVDNVGIVPEHVMTECEGTQSLVTVERVERRGNA